MEESKEITPSLYVHFPFCEAKCHYCDFFSMAEERIPEATRLSVYDALAKECATKSQSRAGQAFETVFLGGGTPSLAPLEVLERTLAPLNLTGSREVTLEANPSSISSDKAKVWRRLGINRVSMGLQAWDDDRLKWLGRVHGVEDARKALEALVDGGIQRISVDYILGVPDQNVTVIKRELTAILKEFPFIGHISAYLLTLNASNPKSSLLPGEEEQMAHLMTAHETLTDFGFEQYEISNYSKPGLRSQHNENYWLGGGYAGVGPSAHAYDPSLQRRTKNWSNIEKYIGAVARGEAPQEWAESLTPEQLAMEHLMLRLRRKDGLSLSEHYRLHGHDLAQEKAPLIRRLIQEGLLRHEADRIKLTPQGLFLSDSVIKGFL